MSHSEQSFQPLARGWTIQKQTAMVVKTVAEWAGLWADEMVDLKGRQMAGN